MGWYRGFNPRPRERATIYRALAMRDRYGFNPRPRERATDGIDTDATMAAFQSAPA